MESIPDTSLQVVPDGYQMIQDNILDPMVCSKAIDISEDGRTAQISPKHSEDGNVKTVLGTFSMERYDDVPEGEEVELEAEEIEL